MHAAKRRYIKRVLREHRSVTEASVAADLNRTHFYRVMRSVAIEPPRLGTKRVNCGNTAWRSL